MVKKLKISFINKTKETKILLNNRSKIVIKFSDKKINAKDVFNALGYKIGDKYELIKMNVDKVKEENKEFVKDVNNLFSEIVKEIDEIDTN
jgi:hypothetical protein